MVPGAGNDVSMAGDVDAAASALAASGSTLYYTSGAVVYRVVAGTGNDVSMATDFDRLVSELTAE